MKRATLIAVLALTILLAMTVSAFAAVNTASGNFQDWDPGHTGNGNGTPHVGFSTTSEKCAVCHSVHNAFAGGSADQNILLRSERADACTYCHIGGTIVPASAQPYGSNALNYETDFNSNHSNKPGPGPLGTYAGCASCHSVHGANTYTDADVVTAILRNNGTADTDLPAGYASGTKPEVLTAFCSQCHPYYTEDYDLSTDTQGDHIMTSSATLYGNSEADASAQATDVAGVADPTCQACHDAVTVVGNNFPHYMPDYSRFLVARPYYGSGTTETVTEPSVDGACIKCHVWNGGASGVGIGF